MGPVVALRPCSVRPHLQQARLPDAHRLREGLLEALAPTSAGVQSVSGALAQLLCPEAVCEEHSQVRSQRQQREGQAQDRLGDVATEMSTAWRAHRRHQACTTRMPAWRRMLAGPDSANGHMSPGPGLDPL